MAMKTNFSDGEWKLMNLLWKKSPLTIGDMVDSLKDDTGWSKNTIFVMLERLGEKGAVSVEEGKSVRGRAVRLYSPLIGRDAAAFEETGSFLDKVWEGSLSMLVSSLTGQKKLSKNELDELKKIIDEAEHSAGGADTAKVADGKSSTGTAGEKEGSE